MKTQLEKMDDSLSTIFSTEPLVPIVEPEYLPEIVSSTSDDIDLIQIENDHQDIRDNIFELIKEGKDTLQHAIDLAKSSDAPRAYEVVAGLMKTLSEMNGQILDLHSKKHDIKKKLGKGSVDEVKHATINNTAIFCGTTAELSKIIGQHKGE